MALLPSDTLIREPVVAKPIIFLLGTHDARRRPAALTMQGVTYP